MGAVARVEFDGLIRGKGAEALDSAGGPTHFYRIELRLATEAETDAELALG